MIPMKKTINLGVFSRIVRCTTAWLPFTNNIQKKCQGGVIERADQIN
jgi:hypothetical protein